MLKIDHRKSDPDGTTADIEGSSAYRAEERLMLEAKAIHTSKNGNSWKVIISGIIVVKTQHYLLVAVVLGHTEDPRLDREAWKYFRSGMTQDEHDRWRDRGFGCFNLNDQQQRKDSLRYLLFDYRKIREAGLTKYSDIISFKVTVNDGDIKFTPHDGAFKVSPEGVFRHGDPSILDYIFLPGHAEPFWNKDTIRDDEGDWTATEQEDWTTSWNYIDEVLQLNSGNIHILLDDCASKYHFYKWCTNTLGLRRKNIFILLGSHDVIDAFIWFRGVAQWWTFELKAHVGTGNFITGYNFCHNLRSWNKYPNLTPRFVWMYIHLSNSAHPMRRPSSGPSPNGADWRCNWKRDQNQVVLLSTEQFKKLVPPCGNLAFSIFPKLLRPNFQDGVRIEMLRQRCLFGDPFAAFFFKPHLFRRCSRSSGEMEYAITLRSGGEVERGEVLFNKIKEALGSNLRCKKIPLMEPATRTRSQDPAVTEYSTSMFKQDQRFYYNGNPNVKAYRPHSGAFAIEEALLGHRIVHTPLLCKCIHCPREREEDGKMNGSKHLTFWFCLTCNTPVCLKHAYEHVAIMCPYHADMIQILS